MKFNKIMFLTIVLLTILSVGAVSAQDISADDAIQNSQDETIQLNSDNDDSLSAAGTYDKTVYVESSGGSDSSAGSQASPYATINKAIESVNASDNAVIYLGSGTFTGENNTNLEVNLAHKNYNGSLTIIGKGNGETVIDANNEAPIFKAISADSIVTLINLTFTHGKNNLGSAITNAGNLTIDNCIFEDNYANTLGAVYYNAANDLTITNTIFRNNYGANGYADIYYTYSEYNVNILNSKFTGSRSGNVNLPSFSIQYANTTIIGNTFENMTGGASNSAGAFSAYYGNGIRKIINNTFINCNYTGSNGAIIYVANAYLENNNFVNCTTRTSPIFAQTEFNAYIKFRDADINSTNFRLYADVTDDVGNIVSTYGNVYFFIDGVQVGSAAAANGVASVNVAKLLDNGIYNLTGTYYYTANNNPFDLSVEAGTLNVSFDHNPLEIWVSPEGNDSGNGTEDDPFQTIKHALDYGLSNTVDLTLHVKEGTYVGADNRGLSYSPVAKLTILGESYGKSIIDAEKAAATIFTFGSNLDVYISNITLLNTTGRVMNVYNLVLNDSIIENVGSFYAQNSAAHIVFDNVTYENSGGLSMYNPEIYNSQFINNNAGTSTGLLWLATSGDYIINIENTKFINNSVAGYSGGAAFYASGNTVLINNYYENNRVSGSGSAVARSSGNKITSINETFVGNNVTSYIAYFTPSGNNPEINIKNITFENNYASANGAGLAVNGGNVTGAKFINNTAVADGGAIYLLNHGSSSQVPNLVLTDVTFENNKATRGNDIFIADAAGANIHGILEGLTITANDLNVSELAGTLTVSITHTSGAKIGGGSITFYIDGSYIGVSDVINGEASFEYLGFKNGTYNFAAKYDKDSENDTYVNGTITVALKPLLDNVTLYVSDSLGDDVNGTGSKDKPFKTIQTALSAGYAQSPVVTVYVLEGNYSGDKNVNLDIPTGLEIAIIGEGTDKTIIHDESANYFINALAGQGSLKISALTVNKTSASQKSMMTIEEGSTVTLDDVIFTRGLGNYGGAINNAGTLIVNNSFFSKNGFYTASLSCFSGGAIYNTGNLLVYNTTFLANHACRAATIYNGGTLEMHDSNITDSITEYGLNMDFMAITGSATSTIKMYNTILSLTGNTPAELTNGELYNAFSRSLTTISVGYCKEGLFINCTFDGGNATNGGSIVFGGLNSWNPVFVGNITVINSTFRDLRTPTVFYDIRNGAPVSNRIFDECLFDNVEFLYAVMTNSDKFNVVINNSVIKSDGNQMIGGPELANYDISNNWWGTNNVTYDQTTLRNPGAGMNAWLINILPVAKTEKTPEKWLILTLNQTGNDVELAFKVFDGENLTDYEGSLPAREFTINATGATVGINNGTITNAVVIPISTDALSYIIQATVDNETVNLTVVKKDTQINVIAINDDLSITGTLTDNDGNPVANVNITYSINDVVENITTDENGEFNIPCLANGEVLMEFSGNNFNLASNKTFTFNGVIKQEVTPEITVPSDLNAGDEAIIIVSVPDATGNVTLIIDGEEHNLTLDENGIATYTIDSIAAGNHSITAVYPGDNKIAPASASATINNVAKEDVIPTIETEDDVKAGDSTVVTVTVPDATGDITLIIDGEEHTVSLDADGVATYTIDDITAGNHSIVAIYAGDDKINPVTAIQSISVSKAEANIEASAEDIAEDEPATIEVTVDGDATGIVLVDIDGKKAYAEINNGKATITIDALKANNYTAIVTYNGNDKYDKVNTTVKFQVTAKPVSNETNNTPAIPENVTVVVNGVNYTAPVVNGTVVVNVPVDNSTGNNTPVLPENVTVVVNGVNYTAPVVNGTVVVDVPINNTPVTPVNNTTSPAELNVTVPNSINAGENATVTVKAPANATGNITVKVDGKEIATVPLVNGSAEVPLNNLTDGAHLVEVIYSGDDQYAPNTVANAIAVSDAVAPTPTPAVKKDTFLYANATLTRVANDNTKTGEKGGDYYVTLKDADGNALVNKTVQIAINGVHYYVQTDENGMAHQQVNMESANVYTYAFAFQGDDDYNAAPLNSTRLTVTKKTTSITGKAQTFKKSAKTKKVVVTLSTSKNPFDGKTYLSSGKKLTLTVAGKTYTAKTNAKNQATFKIKLTKKGKYTAKVKFAGSKIYAASSAKVKITIK